MKSSGSTIATSRSQPLSQKEREKMTESNARNIKKREVITVSTLL